VGRKMRGGRLDVDRGRGLRGGRLLQGQDGGRGQRAQTLRRLHLESGKGLEGRVTGGVNESCVLRGRHG
jgi:hypothetical protein